jgi:hypothetical protein
MDCRGPGTLSGLLEHLASGLVRRGWSFRRRSLAKYKCEWAIITFNDGWGWSMTYKNRFDFCQKTGAYVAHVALHLGVKIGEQAAFQRVVERLSMVLEAMLDGMRPENVAWSLIPQPYNFPAPA